MEILQYSTKPSICIVAFDAIPCWRPIIRIDMRIAHIKHSLIAKPMHNYKASTLMNEHKTYTHTIALKHTNKTFQLSGKFGTKVSPCQPVTLNKWSPCVCDAQIRCPSKVDGLPECPGTHKLTSKSYMRTEMCVRANIEYSWTMFPY